LELYRKIVRELEAVCYLEGLPCCSSITYTGDIYVI